MYLAPHRSIQSVLFVVLWVLCQGNLTLFQRSRTCRLKKIYVKSKRQPIIQEGYVLPFRYCCLANFQLATAGGRGEQLG